MGPISVLGQRAVARPATGGGHRLRAPAVVASIWSSTPASDAGPGAAPSCSKVRLPGSASALCGAAHRHHPGGHRRQGARGHRDALWRSGDVILGSVLALLFLQHLPPAGLYPLASADARHPCSRPGGSTTPTSPQRAGAPQAHPKPCRLLAKEVSLRPLLAPGGQGDPPWQPAVRGIGTPSQQRLHPGDAGQHPWRDRQSHFLMQSHPGLRACQQATGVLTELALMLRRRYRGRRPGHRPPKAAARLGWGSKPGARPGHGPPLAATSGSTPSHRAARPPPSPAGAGAAAYMPQGPRPIMASDHAIWSNAIPNDKAGRGEQPPGGAFFFEKSQRAKSPPRGLLCPGAPFAPAGVREKSGSPPSGGKTVGGRWPCGFSAIIGWGSGHRDGIPIGRLAVMASKMSAVVMMRVSWGDRLP